MNKWFKAVESAKHFNNFILYPLALVRRVFFWNAVETFSSFILTLLKLNQRWAYASRHSTHDLIQAATWCPFSSFQKSTYMISSYLLYYYKNYNTHTCICNYVFLQDRLKSKAKNWVNKRLQKQWKCKRKIFLYEPHIYTPINTHSTYVRLACITTNACSSILL